MPIRQELAFRLPYCAKMVRPSQVFRFRPCCVGIWSPTLTGDYYYFELLKGQASMNISTKRKRLDDIRPLTLAGFAGNVGIVKKITSQLISGHLPTILMFHGPTGVGKTTMCRAIARSMMCKYRRPGSAEPCGKCRTCTTSLDDVPRIAEYEEIGADQLNNMWLQQLSLDSLNPVLSTISMSFRTRTIGISRLFERSSRVRMPRLSFRQRTSIVSRTLSEIGSGLLSMN